MVLPESWGLQPSPARWMVRLWYSDSRVESSLDACLTRAFFFLCYIVFNIQVLHIAQCFIRFAVPAGTWHHGRVTVLTCLFQTLQFRRFSFSLCVFVAERYQANSRSNCV